MPAASKDSLQLTRGFRVPVASTLLVLAAGACLSTGFVAQARPAPNQASRLAGAIADRISSAGTERQNPDGTLSDYVKETFSASPTGRPRNRYGPAVMGAGLVLNGARTSRPAVARAGVRSILSGIRSGEGFSTEARTGRRDLNSQYPFSMLGVLSAWPSVRQKGSSGLGITLRDRRPIRRIIREVAPIPTRSDPARLVNGSNRILLEHLVWLEAIASGLRPLPKGSSPILRRPRATSLRAAEWVESWITSRPTSVAGAFGSVSSLSDAPAWPNAYMALSSALTARAIRVTEPPLRNRLRSLLRRAVRAARLLVSPDGDIAWAGRSNLQSWTLAMTAYAALASTADPGISRTEAGRNRSLAFDLLKKLRSEYQRQDGRLWLVPGLALEPLAGLEGLDWYAAEVPYTGLTLLGLEWAAREKAAGPLVPETPASNVLWPDSDGAALGILRTPGLWVGLRGSSRSSEDARLDSGPVAVKQLSGGSWRWLLHPPPAIPATQPPSWISTSVRPGELAPVRVVGLERRPSAGAGSMSVSVEFPGSNERAQLEVSESECGGLALSGASLPEPVIVSVWLPNPRRDGVPGESLEGSEASTVSFDGGRAFSPTATSVNIGSPQAGSSHPSLSSTSFGFEPGPSGLELDICLDSP